MSGIYEIELRHRADPHEPIGDRHRKFVEVMARYAPPWGLKGEEIPAVPDIPPGNLSATVKLRVLSPRGERSYISYKFRSEKYLKDNAQYDDFVIVRFKPQAAGARLGELFNDVFPAYIEGFDCYRAGIGDSEVKMADWDRVVELCNSTGKDVDGRDGVHRIHPANYFDRELSRRAFGLTPEKIAERLQGKVEKVSMLGDGVLVICRSKLPLPREEYERIDGEVRALLK